MELERNTYKYIKNNDPKDKLDVEIGDSKQDDFKPQFKLMRWDNEVNFSIRAKEKENNLFIKDGEIIKYKTDEYEIYQYEKDDASDEGGFEFEWILNSKPDNNILYATIRFKNVDIFYQDELTELEKELGCERPDNVIGSYALYHKTKMHNYKNGKNYRAGKFCHIYRPKAIDSKGNEVWCKLNIDEKKEELTVEVPKEFLEDAIYPIIVDPTFGYTGTAASDWNCGDRTVGYKATGALGTGDTISAYMKKNSTEDEESTCGLYKESDDTLLTDSDTDEILLTSTSYSWKTYTFSGDPSISAVDYIISVSSHKTDASNYGKMAFDNGVGTEGYYANLGAGSYVHPIGSSVTWTSQDSSWRYSIYCTYTATPVADKGNFFHFI